MKTRPMDHNQVKTYQRRFERLLTQATQEHLVAAEEWYTEAQKVAQKVAYLLGLPLEHGASIVSAFSPRMHWSRNKKLAVSYSLGNRDLRCLTMLLRLADSARENGFNAFKRPKTREFAKAIAGDETAVVVDVWICRAAGLPKDSPTAVQYREISQAVKRIANRHQLTPRTAQALIWCLIRGKAQ